MQFPLHLQEIRFQNTSVSLWAPDEQAVKEAYQNGLIAFPYWSKIWPAARALAQFLLSNPSLVREKSVLEVGAGLGLPSLVAARFAASVLCTDNAAAAVNIAAQSAAHHRLTNFHTDVLDWHALPQNLSADVLLLSDINYEPVAFAALMQMIETFLQKRTTILLSTPQRLMAKDFIAPLLAHCVRQEEVLVQDDHTTAPVTVLMLKKTETNQ